MSEIKLDSHQLEVVEEIKLLGIKLSSDLKWSANKKNLFKKANKRMWVIRRLEKWTLLTMTL